MNDKPIREKRFMVHCKLCGAAWPVDSVARADDEMIVHQRDGNCPAFRNELHRILMEKHELEVRLRSVGKSGPAKNERREREKRSLSRRLRNAIGESWARFKRLYYKRR